MMTTLFAKRLATVGAALLVLSAVPARAQRPAGQSTLTVRVTGLRSDRGIVRLAVFCSPDGFPHQVGRACRTAAVSIQRGQTKVVLDRLPSSRAIAIALVHDENGNGKMDTDWIGRPREGFGASNNPSPRRSAPRFDDARLTMTGPRHEISITARYR